MSLPGNQIQLALYTLFTGDTTLMALLTGGVFDFVTETVATPYLVFGERESAPFDAFARDGHQHSVTLHTWAETHRGKKIVDDILSRLHTLTHGKTITAIGNRFVAMVYDLSMVFQEEDGLTYHGVYRLRVWTHA